MYLMNGEWLWSTGAEDTTVAEVGNYLLWNALLSAIKELNNYMNFCRHLKAAVFLEVFDVWFCAFIFCWKLPRAAGVAQPDGQSERKKFLLLQLHRASHVIDGFKYSITYN